MSRDRNGAGTPILNRADEQLYRAKHAGRNRAVVDVSSG